MSYDNAMTNYYGELYWKNECGYHIYTNSPSIEKNYYTVSFFDTDTGLWESYDFHSYEKFHSFIKAVIG